MSDRKIKAIKSTKNNMELYFELYNTLKEKLDDMVLKGLISLEGEKRGTKYFIDQNAINNQ